MRRVTEFLIHIYYALVGVLCLVVLGYSVATRVVWRRGVQNDLFDVLPERWVLLIAGVAGVVAVLYLVWRHALRGRAAVALPISLIFSFTLSLFCVLSIRGIAVNDGGFLDTCINEFMEGDFSSLYGGYLATYPFQIGYVMFGQLLYLVAGPSNYLVYQLLNIVSILITVYCLYGMTYELSGHRDIAALAALLSLGALCLYAYATLVYNDIWSLAPQMMALYLVMRYLRTGSRRVMAAAILSLAMACVLKSNCYIALVAIVLTLLLAGIREGSLRAFAGRAALALVTAGITIGAVQAVNAGYASAAGLRSMPDGVPTAAYLAMGMHQVEDEGCVKNGWYDGTNAGFLYDADRDSAVAKALARADMAESIEQFRETPRYLVKFYLVKFLQQWGDGTCSSLRQMEMTGRNVEPRSDMAESLMYGTLRDVLAEGMNLFHTVYYLGAVLYFLSVFVRIYRGRRTGETYEISTGEAFLVMFILGGMLFHEMWEASSRYVIRYYLCMIPLAAIGYARVFVAAVVRRAANHLN